ncbi:MAG: alpha/beta fold hydrolase [bacterium]
MPNSLGYRYSGFLLLLCFFALLRSPPASATEYNFSDLLAFYDYDPSQPLNATENLVETTYLHKRYDITFQSVHGETVTGILIKPQWYWAGFGPFPVIMYLHGYGGSSTIDEWVNDILYVVEILSAEPYIILAIDAQYHGGRSVPGRDMFSLNFTQDRTGLATTVMDERRAVDYLQSRPDVIPDQIHLIGVSMGALLGAMTISVEHRFAAAALIVGGGNWTELVSNSQLPPAIPMREALNDHYETIPRYFDMVDPVILIPNASPHVALQMHNGTLDDVVPTGQLLYDAAGPPKQIYWYTADHYTIALYAIDIIQRSLDWFAQY